MIYDWVTSFGVRFDRVRPSHGNSIPRFHMTYRRGLNLTRPRYLEALEIRLERLEHNLDADLDGVYALDLHMERLAGRADKEAISEYRWMVEEYRIQLFARVAVSPKRLSKMWDKVG